DELGDLGMQLLVFGIGLTSYDSEPRRVVHETVLSPARQVRFRPARQPRPSGLHAPRFVVFRIHRTNARNDPTKSQADPRLSPRTLRRRQPASRTTFFTGLSGFSRRRTLAIHAASRPL